MKPRVRAIIIADSSILLIHRVKAGKEYWVFPGGGVEDADFDEKAALERECIEELGLVVAVGDLFREFGEERFYRCEVISGILGSGKGPEFSRDPIISGTYKPEWVPLKDVRDMNVLPAEIRDVIPDASGVLFKH
jgi:8-oxo-dGTP diphosphatase